MSGAHYYNEWDAYAAQWLRNLISAGHIPAGDVDTRSIADVSADDLVGYAQCHFFAGIGGWALAARLAGWPEERELWTGSCPCQPFSVAGKGAGHADDRHLWPHQLRLLRDRRPAVWMGEQVAAAVGKDWLDGVLADLEGIDYAGRAAVVPACAVDGPHRRDRLWIVAERDGAAGHGVGSRLEGHAGDVAAARGRAQQGGSVAEAGGSSLLADADYTERRANLAGRHHADRTAAERHEGYGDVRERGSGAWSGASWIIGHDGKARRTPSAEPGIRLLAHGVPARVGRLRAYGNAIVPQVAAEVIAAYMECRP